MDIREKISKILVKWNLPTRQIVINELVKLVEEEKEKVANQQLGDLATMYFKEQNRLASTKK